ERRRGCADDGGVKDPSTGDPLGKPWHGRSAKVVRHILHGQPKSAVPLQGDLIPMSKFAQAILGGRFRKRGVCHQELNIPVQIDWAMHVRFDLGVEHATRLAIDWVSSAWREFVEEVQ